MSETLVELVRQHGMARLTLNRPERLNSLSAPMHAQLRAALQGLAKQPPAVLVITGAGRGFCGGQDLGEREPVTRGERVDLGESLEQNYNPLARLLQEAPYPTIARINGVAAGAGVSLALGCDLAIAARSATLTLSFVNVGLVPDGGATWHLPRRVGLARAQGLALLGQACSAEQAAQWGLIWRCVEDADLDTAVDESAERLAAAPRSAVLAMRRAFALSLQNGLEAQLAVERDAQRLLGFSDDYRERVTRFLNRRRQA